MKVSRIDSGRDRSWFSEVEHASKYLNYISEEKREHVLSDLRNLLDAWDVWDLFKKWGIANPETFISIFERLIDWKYDEISDMEITLLKTLNVPVLFRTIRWRGETFSHNEVVIIRNFVPLYIEAILSKGEIIWGPYFKILNVNGENYYYQWWFTPPENLILRKSFDLENSWGIVVRNADIQDLEPPYNVDIALEFKESKPLAPEMYAFFTENKEIYLYSNWELKNSGVSGDVINIEKKLWSFCITVEEDGQEVTHNIGFKNLETK